MSPKTNVIFFSRTMLVMWFGLETLKYILVASFFLETSILKGYTKNLVSYTIRLIPWQSLSMS